MTRQLIAGLALVFLFPTSGWAQEDRTTKPSAVMCSTHDRQGHETSIAVEVPYTLVEWDAMDWYQHLHACSAARLAEATARILAEGEAQRAAIMAQSPAYRNLWKKPYNKPLGITGVVMAFAGVAMLLPAGENYHFLGDTYCVTDYSVDAGGCGPGMTRGMWGAIFLGAGVTLGWVGLHDVDIKPYTAPGTKGAKATVSWGGKGK